MIDSEKLFESRIFDICGQARKKHAPVHSTFYSPAELSELTRLSIPNDVNIAVCGGYDGAERKLVIAYPDFICLDEYRELNIAGEIVKLHISNTADRELSHRDYLGSIMSLGIERDCVGDILVSGSNAEVFVCNSISDYILQNLEKISNCRTEITADYEFDGKIGSEFLPKKETKCIVVSSMRLDCVIAEIYNLSRSEAQSAIKCEKVKLNHIVTDKCDKMLNCGDLLSVFGHGRAEIGEVLSETKKNRLRIAVYIYI